MTRPRAAFVSPVVPERAGSGVEQRAFHLLQDLASSFRVSLFIVGGEEERPGSLPEAISLLANEVIYIPIPSANRWAALAAMFFPPLVMLRREWATDWPQPVRLRSPASRGSGVAMVLVYRLRMHDVARSLITVKTHRASWILDMDDMESATNASIAMFALRRGRLRLGLKSLSKAWQCRLIESSALKSYDQIFLSNPKDVAPLARLTGTEKVTGRPNRVVVPGSISRCPSQQIFTLLFVGTLSYFPNADAALWIAECVVPALRQQLSEAFRVKIVGRGAELRLRKRLQLVPEIEFVGETNELACLYSRAHVALIIARCGGGTKIKAMEAFALRCPAVATRHAVRGLPLKPIQHFLCSDTASGVADRCAQLQRDPDQAMMMASRAHARMLELSQDPATALSSINLPS